MSASIHGKVARVLNDRELVFNIGSKDGVALGMFFDVLDPKGTDIKDPETGELLGSVNRPKIRVKITSVQEKLSTASTYRKIKTNIGGQGFEFNISLSKALMPPQWVTKQETFRADEAAWRDLNESESIVKAGDPVIQVDPGPEDGDDPIAR